MRDALGAPLRALLVQMVQPADSWLEQLANHIQQSYKMTRLQAMKLAKQEIEKQCNSES